MGSFVAAESLEDDAWVKFEVTRTTKNLHIVGTQPVAFHSALTVAAAKENTGVNFMIRKRRRNPDCWPSERWGPT